MFQDNVNFTISVWGVGTRYGTLVYETSKRSSHSYTMLRHITLSAYQKGSLNLAWTSITVIELWIEDTHCQRVPGLDHVYSCISKLVYNSLIIVFLFLMLEMKDSQQIYGYIAICKLTFFHFHAYGTYHYYAHKPYTDSILYHTKHT